MKHTIVTFIIAILPLLSLWAQENDTLQREVTIVKEFTPVVRDVEKINTLPPVSTPTFEHRSVNYCYDASSAEVSTQASKVDIPYTHLTDSENKRCRGYFDFGMGLYLAMYGNIGYHIFDTPKDQLNIATQFNSLNGDIPINSHASSVVGNSSRQTFYDVQAGLNYTHTFDNNISMSLRGAYRYLNFNYYGVAADNRGDINKHPFNTAQNVFGEIQIDNKNAQYYDYENWYITLGYSMYQNERGAYTTLPSQEHHGYIHGAYSYMLNNYWSVGGDLKLDYLQYSGLAHFSGDNYVSQSPRHIFVARLLPKVEYRKNKVYFRLGVKADISVNDKTIFLFAPDIRFNWEFVENYFIHAKVDGGKMFHTWHDVSKYCIYFDPSQQIPSTYSPIDAQIGFRFRFMPELSFSAYGGYEIASGALFQSVHSSSQAIAWQSIDASCLKIGGRIDADILQYVTLSLDATYRLWKQGGVPITYDRPRWETNARVIVHPHKKVDVEVGYNMQLDRDFGIYGKLGDIHNLQASINYRPIHWLAIFAKGDNLLNKAYDYYYGLPAPRIQAMLGVGLKF